MNGSNLVLDSNIFIYLSKQKLDFIDISSNHQNLFISAITYMEVLGYDYENTKEKSLIEQLLKSFEIIQTNMEISDKVISYRAKSKIKLPDAIILATSKIMNADLTTANSDDFKNVDKSIRIINPFKNNLK